MTSCSCEDSLDRHRVSYLCFFIVFFPFGFCCFPVQCRSLVIFNFFLCHLPFTHSKHSQCYSSQSATLPNQFSAQMFSHSISLSFVFIRSFVTSPAVHYSEILSDISVLLMPPVFSLLSIFVSCCCHVGLFISFC